MNLSAQFFSTARERQNIWYTRCMAAMDPRIQPPYTEDSVFQAWRFCNVFREQDRTTMWFEQNIRHPIWASASKFDTSNPEDMARVAAAVLIFRWFNRIETGEILKDLILGQWDSKEAFQRLEHVHPLVTGAYMIRGIYHRGMRKLQSILHCIDRALPKLPKMVPHWTGAHCRLERAWEDLKTLDYIGGFMAYEAVSDLRWTPVLCDARDLETWANVSGPGCVRGLSWVINGEPKLIGYSQNSTERLRLLGVMRDLLEMSRQDEYWPKDWPQWEMREVEQWLCEFDKYKRAEGGERLKRRFL
jgi:hypothetical protein